MNHVGFLQCALVCLAAVSAWAAAAPAQEEESGGQLVQLVVGLLHERDKDLRALALEQVRNEAPGQAATRLFAAELPKLSAEAQAGLLGALAERGDAAARPAVLGLLSSGEEAVRAAAIAALGTLGEAADAARLVAALQGSPAEREAARASLVRLRGQAPAAIVAEMKRAPVEVRVALIEVLAARRALESIPSLLSAAVEDEPAVRAAAMTALGQLAGPEHLPGLVQGVLRAEPGAERAGAERAIMFVCARIENPHERAEPLLAALSELTEADRRALLPALGRVGGPEALRVVEAAVADADPALHDAGLRALCNWPNASVAPRLIELAGADEHPEHRAMAVRALIRVAPLPDERPAAERLKLVERVMALCGADEERSVLLQRSAAVRTVETLRFLLPYLDRPALAEPAALAVVELAHHRELRESNRAEFHRALDKVIETSQDEVVVDRAQRYKKNQTWVRPKAR